MAEAPRPELSPFWQFVAEGAADSPSKTALRVIAAEGREQAPVTFAQLRDFALVAAGHLHELGAGVGDIVFSATRNTVASIALCIAVARLGATWAPADHKLHAEQLLALLRVYEPRVCVLSGGRSATAEAMLGELGLQGRTAVLSQDAWEALVLDGGAPRPSPEAVVEASASVLMLLTSGTTGTPKSVVTTSFRIRSVLDAPFFARFSAASGLGQQSLIYFGSPSWISFSAMALKSWEQRHALVFGQRYSRDLYFDAVLRHRPALLFFWPEVLVDFVALPEATQRQVGDFARTLLYGGARTPVPALLRLLRALPDTDVIQAYGATEAMRLAILPAADHAAARAGDEAALRRLRSAGRCSGKLRIVAEGGHGAAPREIGRIQIFPDPRSDFSAYYRNPEATSRKFTEDGWMDIGDLGYLDEDGYLYVEGRDAETIVLLSGDNVYPHDVENVLSELPGVVEVAVAKVEADGGRAEVGAFLRTAPGSGLSEGEVREHCAKRLGQAFSRPAHIFIRSERLPRNKNGKCIKSELTAEARRILSGELGCVRVGGA